MSIIYDALQKTQKKRMPEIAVSTPKASPLKSRWPLALSLFVGFSLSVVILYQGVAHISSYLRNSTIAAANAKTLVPTVVAVPAVVMLDKFKLEHQVNGVFLSKDEKLALIDNKPFHVGEVIGGLKIMSMNLHQVNFQSVANAEKVQLNIG